MSARAKSPDQEPVLQVVSGHPTPAELAAVTVLLTMLTRAGDESEQQPSPAGGWTDLTLRVRRMPPPGPGSWRNSAWS